MADNRLILKERRLLLVEGDQDKRFIARLLDFRNIGGIQIEHTQGKDGLKAALLAWSLTSGFENLDWLSIMQDGDQNPGGTFQRIQGALQGAGLTPPSRAWERSGASPTVLALVLPDGQESGDLETFIWQALAENAAALRVNRYIECLRFEGVQLPTQLSKSRVEAYLASLDPPTLGLGFAADGGLLPLDSPAYDRLIDALS